MLGPELVVDPQGEDFAFLASRAAGALLIVGMMVFGAGLLGFGW